MQKPSNLLCWVSIVVTGCGDGISIYGVTKIDTVRCPLSSFSFLNSHTIAVPGMASITLIVSESVSVLNGFHDCRSIERMPLPEKFCNPLSGRFDDVVTGALIVGKRPF